MKDCSVLWPAPGKELLHWGEFAGKLGADPALLTPFLIGIRGVTLGSTVTHQPVHEPAYKDTFVLVANDRIPPFVFKGSTCAYQKLSKLSPDSDNDGVGDVGSIRPGHYLLKLAVEKPHPIFILTLPDGNALIPAYRDFDHNGVISAEEASKSVALRKGPQVGSDGCYATAVLFHTGFDAPPDAAHRSSIACQTASAVNLKIMAMYKTIDYCLINADEAIDIANSLTIAGLV